jgi:putative colanic acid biosynthesis acetyltransferase WcaF
LSKFTISINSYLVQETDLSKFNNSWYTAGSNPMVRVSWYFINAIIFKSTALIPYSIKRMLLRMFGAKIGFEVVIKPNVNIKYPWNLEIGDNTWVGEGVWIDNLDQVYIGSNACISQGALILSGNHDYSKTTFDLIVKPIHIGDGVWVGAKSIVTQGVNIGNHAVLAVNSVASSDLEEYWIYRGNPCQKINERRITE